MFPRRPSRRKAQKTAGMEGQRYIPAPSGLRGALAESTYTLKGRKASEFDFRRNQNQKQAFTAKDATGAKGKSKEKNLSNLLKILFLLFLFFLPALSAASFPFYF